MDYGTFFVTNITSVAVFTVCICVLAWYNRRVTGMLWFAGAQVAALTKLIFQALEGKVPALLGGLMISDLYLVAVLMQWMGLHWFVVRKPFGRWPWTAASVVLAIYAAAFIAKIPYTVNLINLPFIVVCGACAWILWRNAKAPFTAVARVCSVVAALQMGVATYRAILTNLRYIYPGESIKAHSDSLWVDSLAAAAALATCMAMCETWFLVTELQRELERRARTDSLTGALNRRSMEEAALQEAARSQRYGNALSMIVVDIDNFKRLNDSRGHAAGDCALQAVVRGLSCMLRQQDSLARMGGEEFAILLPDTSVSAALTLADRLRVVVAGLEIGFESGPIKITICAGVAQFNPAYNWEEMMRRADAAMYAAKRRGRNRASACPDFEEPSPEKHDPHLDALKLLPIA